MQHSATAGQKNSMQSCFAIFNNLLLFSPHYRPRGACIPLQNIAAQCHSYDPKARPTFAQIVAHMQKTLQTITN